MEKDHHKRKLMEDQIKKQNGLEIKFITGVEGRKLSTIDINNYTDFESFKSRYKDLATLPALGCSLSHWKIYNEITKSSDINSAMILEDDAILSDNIANNLNLYIDYIENLELPTVILLTPDFRYKKSDLILCNDYSKLYKVHTGSMTSGYLINRKAAFFLKEKLMPIRYLADSWSTFAKMGLNIMGIVPHLISYPDGLGEIGKSQHNQKRTPIMLIRYRLANIKGIISKMILYAQGYRKSKKIW